MRDSWTTDAYVFPSNHTMDLAEEGMENKQKNRVLLKHRKSSALVVSLVIHAVFILAALSFVAVKIYIKPEQTFEVKEVKRPNIKLRKLQVPVKERKKTQAPRLRKTIVAKPKNPQVDIKMPEIVGVKGGTGYGNGGGLGGLGFSFDLPDLFGSNSKGSGNEFVGHFYDLKQSKDGKLSAIGELLAKANGNWDDPSYKASREKYREAVARFLNGWDDDRLNDYFMAPREKFATAFMIPQIDAEAAPKAFGVEDQVNPMEWLALYRGTIVAPESGKYRFVGRGDDVLIVRVKKKLVIDASWIPLSEWESSDPDNAKYKNYNSGKGCVIGDWFYLQKGKPVPMEVLIGEEPGGHFFSQLYIQQDGVHYPTITEVHENKETGETKTIQRPILPIFKTAEIPDEVVSKMNINPKWATRDGPSFGSVP